MVWDRIKSIFTKEKKFAIYVADRGKKIKVGVVEAKDHSELSDKIIALLEDKPEYHEYPRIHIIDLSTGESIRLKNPFVEDSLSEEAPKRSKSSSGINPSEIESMLRNALELQGSMYKTILQSMFSDVVELAKDLVKVRVGLTQPAQQEKTTLKDIAQLATSLVWLIQNWDKVNVVLKEANVGALLGGQLNLNIKEGEKK